MPKRKPENVRKSFLSFIAKHSKEHSPLNDLADLFTCPDRLLQMMEFPYGVILQDIRMLVSEQIAETQKKDVRPVSLRLAE